jgi:hypothetical protein
LKNFEVDSMQQLKAKLRVHHDESTLKRMDNDLKHYAYMVKVWPWFCTPTLKLDIEPQRCGWVGVYHGWESHSGTPFAALG